MQRVDLRGSRATLSDLAYSHILEAILTHEVLPGQRLRPEDLAAAMCISPTPVKQALARLAGEGLVENRTGLGTFVVAPAEQELIDLTECRVMCEIQAVRHGIGWITPDFLGRLDELRLQCESALLDPKNDYPSQQGYWLRDREFHSHLVSLWPNKEIQIWYRYIRFKVGAYQMVWGGIGSTGNYRPREAIAEHKLLCEALGARNAHSAIQALEQHAAASRDALIAICRSRAALRPQPH